MSLPFSYFDAVLWTVAFALLPKFINLIQKSYRDRYTHSLLMVASVFFGVMAFSVISPYIHMGAANYFCNLSGAIFAVLGVLSHIVADSLTAGGVPFFYPFSKKMHMHLPLIGRKLRYPNNHSHNTVQLFAVIVLILLVGMDVISAAIF